MSRPSWFTTDYAFAGSATVIFEDPHAEFYGTASVRPGKGGRPTVEMSVERSRPAIETDIDLAEIQFGSESLPGGGKCIPIGTDRWNSARVVVDGEGAFRGGPTWDYEFSNVGEGSLTLRLSVPNGQYTATEGTAKFLVLPLTNFASELPLHPSAICDHPLRLSEDPDSGACLTFQIGDERAFIQMRAAESSDGLISDEEARVTAIAVLPLVDTEMSDPWGWFLTVFLRLLGIATGRDIGFPWAELRDASGHLVQRLHMRADHKEQQEDGYGAMGKAIHWAGGEFLSRALSCPAVREPFFSIALRHCFRAGLPGLTLDDQLDHLVRALECLCARYGFSSQNLASDLEPATKAKVQACLGSAGTEIRKLVPLAVEPAHRSLLARIADRANSAAQTDRSFGLAVEELVRHFGLRDVEVLGPYYGSRSILGGKSWVQTLSYYRGAVFHEGFIDVDSPGTPIGEVLGFILHLHDFVVRILLKIIGYTGTYQPRLIRATAAETADWLRPEVKLDRLLKVPTMSLR